MTPDKQQDTIISIHSPAHADAALAALDRVLQAQAAYSSAMTAGAGAKDDPVRNVCYKTLDAALRLYQGVLAMPAPPAPVQATPAPAQGKAAASGARRPAAPARQAAKRQAPAPSGKICPLCGECEIIGNYKQCTACYQDPDRVVGVCTDCGEYAKPEYARCYPCNEEYRAAQQAA